MDPLTLALLAQGGGTLLGGAMDFFGNKSKADAARKAINQQMSGENNAYGIGSKYYNELQNTYAPEAATYNTDLSSWRDLAQQNPITMSNFDTSKYNVNAYLDPSMKYQQEQAAKAVQQSAAARGGMFAGSGATAKALQDRATQLAQTDYGNAFNRMNTDRGFGYDMFKDKYASDLLAQNTKLKNFADILGQSGAARENLLAAKGGAADLGMSHERTLSDLLAGKSKVAGDLASSNWGTAGNLFRGAGSAGGDYFSGQADKDKLNKLLAALGK